MLLKALKALRFTQNTDIIIVYIYVINGGDFYVRTRQ